MQLDSSTGCHSDSVDIFDGDDTTAPLVNSFCGRSRPPDVMTTRNKAYVVFTSDGSKVNTYVTITYNIISPVEGKINTIQHTKIVIQLNAKFC